MQIGDLVTLSAYGKKVERTGWIEHDDIGVIIGIRRSYWNSYEVLWNKSRYNKNLLNYKHEKRLDRRDLKFVRGT